MVEKLEPKIEKEPTFEEIREYLEKRKDFYAKNELGDISPLLKELNEQKYENILEFFERIVGQPIEPIKRGQVQVDLISEKVYPQGEFGKEDKDIKKESYKEKKNYLRRIVEKLTKEAYKDRENFTHLSVEEQKGIFDQMAISIDFGGEKFVETEEKFKKGDYSDLFDFIDFKVVRSLKNIADLRKKGREMGVKHELESLERLRRARLFFSKKIEAGKR